MFALESAGEAYDIDAVELPASELERWRDPAGTDVGERHRPVRLSWVAWWGEHEFSGIVCCPDRDRALDRVIGPAEVVTTLCKSIYTYIVTQLNDHLIGGPRCRCQQEKSVTVRVLAEYHWQPPRMRKRGDKQYPVAEQLMRRPWVFTTGDPRSSAFWDGFRELHCAIRRERWPLDTQQQADINQMLLTVQAGQLSLPLYDAVA